MTKHLLSRSHHIHLHLLVSPKTSLSLILPRTYHFKTMTQQFPRRKFIVDVDTGIDDAMALVLALDAHKRGEERNSMHFWDLNRPFPNHVWGL